MGEEKQPNTSGGGGGSGGKHHHHHNHHHNKHHHHHHGKQHDHHGKHHHHHHRNNRKNSHSSKSHSPPPTRESLWTGATIKSLESYGNLEWQVEMTGVGSSTHTVYARAVHKDSIPDTIDPDIIAKAEDTPAT